MSAMLDGGNSPLLGQPTDKLIEIIYHKNERIDELQSQVTRLEGELAQAESLADELREDRRESVCHANTTAQKLERERELSDQLVAALREIRCWIGQTTSAEKAGAKCEMQSDALEMVSAALVQHAASRANSGRNSGTDPA